MKWMMIWPLLLALSCRGNAEAVSVVKQKEPEPVMGGPTHLTMTFKDFEFNGFARLIGFYSDQNYLVDSTAVTNGKIDYSNPKGLAQGIYYVMFTGRKEFIQIIMGEDQEFDMQLSLFDPLNTMVVTGSQENELFYENMRYETNTIGPRMNELNAQVKNTEMGSEAYMALKKERDGLEAQRLQKIYELREKYPNLLFTSYKYGGQNPKLREELSKKTPEELFEILKTLDPERANAIDGNNPRRLVRAIEIAQFKEQGTMSKEQKTLDSRSLFPAHCSLLLALCPPKDILDAKIKARLDARFDEGMIDEVTRLHTEGVSWERLDAFGLEYRSVSRYLRNIISESEMKERLLFEIIHYAKRQMTWIRRWHRKNPNLHIVETPEEAMERAEAFFESK